ncbi:hypothetical protein BKG91_03820 [Rodentibacter caecimuris]|uniref:Uncharacterized protein n=1 Tax=Rodentibacter caecimuris TaxID=1796644 RepID=A0AAJ3K2M1_9PAST|nr:hypothetical protein [Rodentibacter heylii]OOF70575.1 hypothetical protein BKG90_09810 [Rodentibacter heylii]OOF75254.1 hypothetical protein BKG91_03820 [Rodentibacter heylii]OOF77190.1 hypothetical protein BKG99_03990 [Rodentibacter heylii]
MCELRDPQEIGIFEQYFMNKFLAVSQANWEKVDVKSQFDKKETLAKSRAYLDLAKEKGFEQAYAKLELDFAEQNWVLHRAALAEQEKLLKQYYEEKWRRAFIHFEQTKRACHPCKTDGQKDLDNVPHQGNKSGEDIAQSVQIPANGDIQLFDKDNQDGQCQCDKCVDKK